MATAKNCVFDTGTLAQVLDFAPIATLLCDQNYNVVYANAACEAFVGCDAQQLFGKNLNQILRAHDTGLAEYLVDISAFEGPHRFDPIGDAEPAWGLVSVAEYSPGGGEPYWMVQVADFDYQQERFEALSYRESIWRYAIGASRHGVWDYDTRRDLRFYSDEWKRIRGFDIDAEICGSAENWESRIHPDDLERVREVNKLHHLGEKETVSYEYREQRVDGKWIWVLSRGGAVEWDDQGVATRFTGTDVDITSMKLEEEKRREEAEAAYEIHVCALEEAQREAETARSIAHSISRQDPLTGLPNRRVHTEYIDELIERNASQRASFAVLLIDLDRFKPINDIYGHETGDFVICQVAARLEEIIGPMGIVARLGGDEFGVVVVNKNLSTGDFNDDQLHRWVENLATDLIRSIENPILTEHIRAEISASIGIATYPAHGNSAQSLVRASDLAMYHVKKNGRAAWSLFNADFDIEMRATAKLESDTRQAVTDRVIEPYFQPVIDLQNDRVYGFEILARWVHPELGFVPPDRFIPIIEQFGLMKEFSSDILRKACMAAKEWPSHLKLALNISAVEVCDPATPLRLAKILEECGILPTRLEIEVTETALVHNFDVAKSVIAALREAGIRVLLDDFGTGYSSLGYLRELTFDCLKIDRSFLQAMENDSEAEKIVLSMLTLAQSLGMHTVAEGIENEAVHERIRAGNGTFGQGYFYSKAVPAAQVSGLLSRQLTPQRQIGATG